MLGNEHPETLLSVGNLGVLLCRMGKHADAAVLLQEARSGLSSVYGEEHHDAVFYWEGVRVPSVPSLSLFLLLLLSVLPSTKGVFQGHHC